MLSLDDHVVVDDDVFVDDDDDDDDDDVDGRTLTDDADANVDAGNVWRRLCGMRAAEIADVDAAIL